MLLVDSDDTEKQRIGTAQCKNLVNKVKEANEFSGASHLKYGSKNTSRLFNPQAKKICTDSNDLHFANNDWPKEENGSNGLPDLNIPATAEPVVSTTLVGNFCWNIFLDLLSIPYVVSIRSLISVRGHCLWM